MRSTTVITAALALLALSGSARGGFRVDLEGELPCTRAELDEAVGARVALDEAGSVIEIAGAPGKAAIRFGERSRVIDLGALRGTRAARLVALAVSDLLEQAGVETMPEPAPAPPGDAGDDAGVIDDEPMPDVRPPRDDPDKVLEPQDNFTPPPKPARAKPGPPARSARADARRRADIELGMPDDGTVSTLVSRARAPRGSRYSLYLVPALGLGGEGATMTVHGTLALSGPLGSRRFLAELTASHVPTEYVPTGEGISMSEETARLALGDRWGSFSFYFGAHYTLYQLELQPWGSLFGVGGRAFLAPRLSGRLRLVIGGALDYYTEQLHVLIGGQQAFATPRLGLQLGIGLGWNL